MGWLSEEEPVRRDAEEVSTEPTDVEVAVDAHVSVLKAVVTQASSAIPIMPLYLSLLFKVMKQAGSHEGCIEQINRLFTTQLYNKEAVLDEKNRFRVDDLELDANIQSQVEQLWPKITTENLYEMTDFASYQCEFLSLFGFGLKGVDYEADVDIDVAIPGI